MDEGTNQEREVARLLQWATSESTPEPPADLVQRSLRAVRGLILRGDLVRFATFEALWQRFPRSRSASEAGESDPPEQR